MFGKSCRQCIYFQVSFIAPLNGVRNIMVMSATRLAQGMSTKQATPVTRDRGRGISRVSTCIYLQHFTRFRIRLDVRAEHDVVHAGQRRRRELRTLSPRLIVVVKVQLHVDVQM